MRAFAVSGFSGTGKTTLIERIIRALVDQGYSVVTAKSTMHELQETEDKDSFRHRKAGAMATVILGPQSTTIIQNERRNIHDFLSCTSADFLIIEGMKQSSIPKIWCVGDFRENIGKLPESVKAIVAWTPRRDAETDEVPLLLPNEMKEIVEIVLREAVDISEIQF